MRLPWAGAARDVVDPRRAFVEARCDEAAPLWPTAVGDVRTFRGLCVFVTSDLWLDVGPAVLASDAGQRGWG